jgi:hypothetical protein
MELYLFGPMRGIPDANRAAFREARETLRDMGHNVFCPSELTDNYRAEKIPYNMIELMRIDLNWICNYAEGLVGLEGWNVSKGSLVEVHLAWFKEIPVYEYESFKRRIIREVKGVPHLRANG